MTSSADSPDPARKALGPAIAFVVAALLAVGVAACGGSDDPASNDASTSSQTASHGLGSSGQGNSGSQSKKAAAESKKEQGGQPPESVGESQLTSDSGSGSSGVSDSATSNSKLKPVPLKVSGGGSQQFIQKYGDNSIAEYGEEASESELRQAAETVHGYLVAVGESDWVTTCSYMSKSLVERFEKIFAQAPEVKAKGCAEMLDNFYTQAEPEYIARARTEVNAGSLRHEGDDQAFLIYYGPGTTVYAMTMSNDDGQWKVANAEGLLMYGKID